MSLKDNFSQAVKEILRKDGIVGDNLSKKAEKSELDRYLEPNTATEPVRQVQPQREPQAAAPAQPKPQSQNSEPQAAKPSYATSQQPREAVPVQPHNPIDSPYVEVEEQTIISRNTVIEGNVRSFANITVEGSIKGDIFSTKNANVSGKLVGNLECNNASMLGSQMQGSIASKGQVKFDRDSLILGNVTAAYLDMNGKVKGNLEINGKAEFKCDAYIIGDINVATLTVSEGATISGHVNTTYLQEPQAAVFPEMISMSELG